MLVDRPHSWCATARFDCRAIHMYVGVVVYLVGLALWIGTWPFYMAVPVAFLFLNFFHIPREERMLREVFGERYLAYSETVRRWL